MSYPSLPPRPDSISPFASFLVSSGPSSQSTPGRTYLTYLEKILDQNGAEAAINDIQTLYHDPTLLPCHWFTDATNASVAGLLTRFTKTLLEDPSMSMPWSREAATFVNALLMLTCDGAPYCERSGGNKPATRCKRIFHRCVQEMDQDTSIFCFWLFTQTDFSITMTPILLKDLFTLWTPVDLEGQTRKVDLEGQTRKVGHVRSTIFGISSPSISCVLMGLFLFVMGVVMLDLHKR